MLADVVLDEVVGAALLDVYAFVAVRAEGVVVDPVAAAHVDVDVVGATTPQLNLRRLRACTIIALEPAAGRMTSTSHLATSLQASKTG